jgi:DNA-binding response OmpR family regulator
MISAPRWFDSGTARVLVVLDRPVLSRVIRLTLNHVSCDVRVATTRDQIVTALAEWRPHLLILDMDLNDPPGSALPSGCTVAEEAGVPIIGLVQRGDLSGQLAAYEAGVEDILTMPFVPDELLARAVNRLRRSHGALRFWPSVQVRWSATSAPRINAHGPVRHL